jgi:hypothetical protein
MTVSGAAVSRWSVAPVLGLFLRHIQASPTRQDPWLALFSRYRRFSALGINLKTVVLKILCNAGWTDAAGKFIAQAVLVDLNLDTGLVGPHFENDPEALNAGGPMSVCGLLFEPAGLDDGSSLILHPASDFAGKATGFHLASQSLSTYKQQLKQWASRQETLPLVTLCYRNANAVPVERAAA